MTAVLGIVRGHKGAIEVSGEPGSGTTFKVFLPANASLQAPDVRTGGPDHWCGQGPALLVDDVESVRTLWGQTCRELRSAFG